MPQATLDAFADHGRTTATILDDDTMALGVHRGLARAGINLEQMTAELEREGVKAFCDSYDQLLARIEQRVRELAPPPTVPKEAADG